jgi:hypothetical protein
MDTMLIRTKDHGKRMNVMESETDLYPWADELGCFQGCVDKAWIGMHVAHKRESGVMDQIRSLQVRPMPNVSHV